MRRSWAVSANPDVLLGPAPPLPHLQTLPQLSPLPSPSPHHSLQSQHPLTQSSQHPQTPPTCPPVASIHRNRTFDPSSITRAAHQPITLVAVAFFSLVPCIAPAQTAQFSGASPHQTKPEAAAPIPRCHNSNNFCIVRPGATPPSWARLAQILKQRNRITKPTKDSQSCRAFYAPSTVSAMMRLAGEYQIQFVLTTNK